MQQKTGISIASLKHTKAIQFLLSSGQSGLKHPILIKYCLAEKRHPTHPEFIFTPVVSSKKIKKACDRNLIKRRIRNAVSSSIKQHPSNQSYVSPKGNQQLQALYIYLDREIIEYTDIESAINKLHKKTIFKKLFESR